MHRLFFLLLILVGCTQAQSSDNPIVCRRLEDNGRHLEQRSGPYLLALNPTNDDEHPCLAKLFGPNKKLLWKKSLGWASLPVPPVDITNDGDPDLIIEDYSMGAHCCWTYWILSPGRPRILSAVLENERDVDFTDQWRGKPVIATMDGAFDYFITSHAFSFMPDVYLLLEGNKLIDMSGEPEFRNQYDQRVSEAEKELLRLDPRKNWLKQDVAEMDDEVKFNVLRIVLSYLYSRRPNEAWRRLSELWPSKDVTKLKADILETRKKGILKQAVPYSQTAAKR